MCMVVRERRKKRGGGGGGNHEKVRLKFKPYSKTLSLTHSPVVATNLPRVYFALDGTYRICMTRDD